MHKPGFIGAMAVLSIALALILLFVVLRCRRSRAARKGRKLDAEIDAAFRATVEKERAVDVESGAGGGLYRAQSTQSAMSASYALPPLSVEQQPQYNYFAQQGPYSAAPDHAGSAYLAAAPANAYASGDPVHPYALGEPQFEMVMPPQPQAQAYPQAGPARAELHRRPTQQHVYPAQEYVYPAQEYAHQSGLAQRPASPSGNPFESAEGQGRPMAEIPLSPLEAYQNPYAAYAA